MARMKEDVKKEQEKEQLHGGGNRGSSSSSSSAIESSSARAARSATAAARRNQVTVSTDSEEEEEHSTTAVSTARSDPIKQNGTGATTMQQRQFTRMRDGIELDDMEAGVGSSGGAAQSLLVEQDQYALNGNGNGQGKGRLHLNGLASASVGGDAGSSSSLSRTKKDDGDVLSAVKTSEGLTDADKRAMDLLVALYLLQGIPVGLAFGSIPYLLRAKLSYSQIGIFTLCTYPYSLKLLWSPVVDSCYSARVGRRKSWIIPVQYTVAVMLWWLSRNIDGYLEKEVPDVRTLTALFFTLVFFAATQDIAVDGWALTLLSKGNLSYASTAQTIGLNIGYFLSFTVFLAFNSVEFSNKYFRPASAQLDYPLVSLAGYLRWAALAYAGVTTYLAFFQPEDAVIGDDEDMDLRRVYTIMYRICKLKHVQKFALVHLVSKLGAAAHDAATSLKLLEKGLSKEDLALAVLIDFPFQILFGWLAARWSTGERPLRPWVRAMWARLGFAVIAMLLIHNFPVPSSSGDEKSSGRNIPTYYFLLVISTTVFASFAGTVQFVGISAFHTIIADPQIGGTYMTLLNTVSNLGGTWPRYFVLQGVDGLTKATCHVASPGGSLDDEILISAHECVSEHGKAACADLGGRCITERDGYYATSTVCILLGVVLLFTFIQPTARKLQALPGAAWRVKLDRQ